VSTLLLVHAGATLGMTGVIWFVQIVQYPLMARVGPDEFVGFHAMHTRRTGWVVGPLMLVEVACALGIALLLPVGVHPPAAWAGVGLLAVIWLSTALVQVPQHRRLSAGFDPALVARLVRGNWLRTVAWSLRAGLALWWLAPA
jgi:hypothetical protein